MTKKEQNPKVIIEFTEKGPSVVITKFEKLTVGKITRAIEHAARQWNQLRMQAVYEARKKGNAPPRATSESADMRVNSNKASEGVVTNG